MVQVSVTSVISQGNYTSLLFFFSSKIRRKKKYQQKGLLFFGRNIRSQSSRHTRPFP
jgi:hypothetical protein